MPERLNVNCDDRAKKLIKEETRGVTVLPLVLSSPRITSKLSTTVPSCKKGIMLCVPLAQYQE